MMQFKKSLQNQMKKMTAFALVTAIVSADLCFIHTENAYAASLNMGVENHWAEPFMQNLYNRGLMSGDKYGNMNPDKQILRGRSGMQMILPLHTIRDILQVMEVNQQTLKGSLPENRQFLC